MGTSTNAILFYGYCWEEETELFPGTDDWDWPKVILQNQGAKNPWDDFVEAIPGEPYKKKEARSEAWRNKNRAALDKWYEEKESIKESRGVNLDVHCSSDYPIPYLAAKGSETKSRRGSPEEIVSLDVKPGWREKLDGWLAEMGVERPQAEPKWWLVSYWV